MIQSGIFDSFTMDIKKITNSLLIFTINRLIEIVGIIISMLGILLLVSLISYSPSDPNFIFPENTEVKNILGYQGSYISDLFLQSAGLISYLISLTYIFTGINIFNKKELFLIIENTFFTVIYTLFGSLLFSYFHKDAFELYINGNGGFIGNYLSQSFLKNIIHSQETIFFYILIFLTVTLFLLSINFKINRFIFFVKKIFQIIFKSNTKNYTNKNEVINEYIPQEEIKNLIQEDLPFIKTDSFHSLSKSKFKLPSLELLKTPTKKERENSDKGENHDSEFLEKILLDFGVDGTIKKANKGPVVTLNEFEPAAGIKVSKIINLSDDIARNTSSESARIAIIPGSNTVGIELPNLSRENVYLSEIINNSDFKKTRNEITYSFG